MQESLCSFPIPLETLPEQRLSALSGKRASSYVGSFPVFRIQQSNPETSRSAPWRGLAITIPDTDFPIDKVLGGQILSLIEYPGGFRTLDFSGIPDVSLLFRKQILVRGRQDLISRLTSAILMAFQPPAQRRPSLVNSQWIDKILAPQITHNQR